MTFEEFVEWCEDTQVDQNATILVETAEGVVELEEAMLRWQDGTIILGCED